MASAAGSGACFVNGATPLWHYAAHGDLPGVQQLLQAGADPNKGRCPPHGSGATGHSEHAPQHSTPLSVAAARGRLNIVKALLACSRTNVTAKCLDGATALHTAKAVAVPLLLEAGADSGAVDSHGDTPLLYACRCTSEALVTATVRAHVALGTAPLAATNKRGHTALYYLARRGCSKAVALLLSAGADPNTAIRPVGDTCTVTVRAVVPTCTPLPPTTTD